MLSLVWSGIMLAEKIPRYQNTDYRSDKNVRVPFNVNIGVGDGIVPRAEERKINTQLPDFEAPVIMTYSLVSTIAKTLDVILQRFELTGRMKDFCDIYYLGRAFDFDGAKLQTAIERTLERRGTPYDMDGFKRIIVLADGTVEIFFEE